MEIKFSTLALVATPVAAGITALWWTKQQDQTRKATRHIDWLDLVQDALRGQGKELQSECDPFFVENTLHEFYDTCGGLYRDASFYIPVHGGSASQMRMNDMIVQNFASTSYLSLQENCETTKSPLK
eukprot:CAMPEP_0177747176 /NCGR_PEP_ID=MMETSP0484_2-20121128/31261_1 /TAXON_ID=354590 /ORGANISM="Rhodomonas lens, Strain RHODO" /LENGTH=126 /DNA_ID=CAMNT_0019261971 /DNA_START=52 /DNA_END=429 /DNA_ORIENTATION=-